MWVEEVSQKNLNKYLRHHNTLLPQTAEFKSLKKQYRDVTLMKQ